MRTGPMIPLWLTLALLLATVCGMAYLGYQRESAAAERATQAEKALVALQAKHRSLAAQLAVTEAKRQIADKELKDVLAKNRDWADSPVPDAVVDSLCKRLRCN